MKSYKIKNIFLISLATVAFFALAASFCLWQGRSVNAETATKTYQGEYRNRLAYSAHSGWNNDPNGLLFADGIYHMYYQYNWDESANATENVWGHMSWGHATSTDLVHWDEQPVAIPEGLDGYGMMFSGSAVYDENNTSELFDTDGNGKVVKGQGIVAILTQPDDSVGGQRQILAYSKNCGQSFEIEGEILGAKDDGKVGDGEFRDPKVFWSEAHERWLMAVGGGSVRMYSSENLKKWDYLGATGYWGECPDISRYEVNGKEKYVLIISPEDKNQSHKYNKTTREDTYYPAEYYVVGELNKDGLFVSDGPVKRLSQGIDSYAFQSFNSAPDDKVYGVSWSASWKTVDYYRDFRKFYNGGMTVVTELNLVEENGEYYLTRTPVENYETLRSGQPISYDGTLKKGYNALAGIRADVAEIQAELDFNGSNATYAELCLRVSAAERISITYDKNSETLTLDRSQSSLLAKDTFIYQVPFKEKVALQGGKLVLDILLDRAFISVFANGGRASYFAAAFPSASSNAMTLMADGDIKVKADVYQLDGIFEFEERDELIVTTDKIDMTVGSIGTVIASSFAKGFDGESVTFAIAEGANKDVVEINTVKEFAYIKALKNGSTKITVSYGSQIKEIEIYVYGNGFVSDVDFRYNWGGFSYIGDSGLFFSTGVSDAFRFSDTYGENIIYSAQFTPANDDAQAGGIVFGASDNLTAYWVATADLKQNKVKLWQAGVGDLKTADYLFEQGKTVKLTVVVSDGTAKVFVNDSKVAAITQKLENYRGGKVGLNVYNSSMYINGVTFTATDSVGHLYVGGYSVLKVINLTDGNHVLGSDDYNVSDGVLTISESYLKTLEENTQYSFRVVTSFTEFTVKITTEFTSFTLSPTKNDYSFSKELTLTISGETDVYRVEVDGIPCEFRVDGTKLTVIGEIVENLSRGEHTVKVYTKNGRPTATVTVSTTATNQVADDIEAKPTYVFLIVDIAIFISAIAGYAIYSVISKRKQR